jgi:hypothetical protein
LAYANAARALLLTTDLTESDFNYYWRITGVRKGDKSRFDFLLILLEDRAMSEGRLPERRRRPTR